ncbi:hypothetical protein BGZ74_002178 [Mortierella antarctica]|nr:hypothetical protein BGZ74_002178 [Mortierella antarctica]
MNKHLQQPASMGVSPELAQHSEQSSNPGKKQPSHGPTTQSTFKTDPNLHSQQQSSDSTEAKKQYHGATKKTPDNTEGEVEEMVDSQETLVPHPIPEALPLVAQLLSAERARIEEETMRKLE